MSGVLCGKPPSGVFVGGVVVDQRGAPVGGETLRMCAGAVEGFSSASEVDKDTSRGNGEHKGTFVLACKEIHAAVTIFYTPWANWHDKGAPKYFPMIVHLPKAYDEMFAKGRVRVKLFERTTPCEDITPIEVARLVEAAVLSPVFLQRMLEVEQGAFRGQTEQDFDDILKIIPETKREKMIRDASKILIDDSFVAEQFPSESWPYKEVTKSLKADVAIRVNVYEESGSPVNKENLYFFGGRRREFIGEIKAGEEALLPFRPNKPYSRYLIVYSPWGTRENVVPSRFLPMVESVEVKDGEELDVRLMLVPRQGIAEKVSAEVVVHLVQSVRISMEVVSKKEQYTDEQKKERMARDLAAIAERIPEPERTEMLKRAAEKLIEIGIYESAFPVVSWPYQIIQEVRNQK